MPLGCLRKRQRVDPCSRPSTFANSPRRILCILCMLHSTFFPNLHQSLELTLDLCNECCTRIEFFTFSYSYVSMCTNTMGDVFMCSFTQFSGMGFTTLEPFLPSSLQLGLSNPLNQDTGNKLSTRSRSQLISVTDTLTNSGQFLLYHFISVFLRRQASGTDRSQQRPRVVLVAFYEVWSYWCSVLSKLGVNLQTHRDSGALSFVDGHSMLFSTANILSPAENSQVNLSGDTASPSILDNALSRIRSILTPADMSVQQTPSLLIIDDLTVLLYSGVSLECILEFLDTLRTLADHVRLL
ncbi:hypothetical protein M427DRAFT_328904 [Gonapodya prolifera JEL478]|uniref:Elongator complex protein 6 n=1 Tax=Gonapodya prolifera (strain JEL478) TaxID=1344416 RepID=A0A139AE51_GONPJ|nr:hypothetical protein M427DRAFT_328904 [Gonapodya prolifera JEL478]|eukprot:KXS15092.1 hypothetical protein M427DRAFT_328904 [Gonapodya prolifera JEL478]